MKILLNDKIIGTREIDPAVQVAHYNELCGVIKQLATEPFDLAIVLNDRLAKEIILNNFFKELSGLKSISFYGNNFIFTKKYIEYFNLLQQELSINIYYTGKLGTLQRMPEFFIEPLVLEPKCVNQANNIGLFNECNRGCWKDKKYFTNAINPPSNYALNGDLTIDYTGEYKFPILINGGTFDGCCHTITLDSDRPLNEEGGSGLFGGLFDLQKGQIINLKIIVNIKYVTLANEAGWLCASGAASNGDKIECLIDNCHVCAELAGFRQGGLVGYNSFNGNTDSTFTIQNCSFSGDISGINDAEDGIRSAGGIGNGGIVSDNSFSKNISAVITIQNCHFIGNINGSNHSGIVGDNNLKENKSTTITIQNCSFIGDVNGDNNSGIVDDNSFNENEYPIIIVQDCCFIGNIYGGRNSGIIGLFCFNENKYPSITVRACCFTGNITGDNNSGTAGLLSFSNNESPIITVQDCHFVGNINGDSNGGTIGTTSFDLSLADGGNNNVNIAIHDCSFSGNVSGINDSGIISIDSFRGDDTHVITGNVIINNCIVSGDISGSFWGGIAGTRSFVRKQPQPTIQNCYSFCSIAVKSQKCGGILGPFCGNDIHTTIFIKECFSTGTILNSTSYAILGFDTMNCTVSNCIYNSFYNTKAGFDYPVGGPPLNNTYPNTFGTPNIAGHNNPNTAQIISTLYERQLHLKVLNTEPYQKQNKALNIVAAFSICKPLAVCNILTFILNNVCNHEHLFIYSKDMKFKSPLYWDSSNVQYNGTLASGTYIIAIKRH